MGLTNTYELAGSITQPEGGFTFDDPSDLSSETLFRLFLCWTDRSALENYRNPDDGRFYFPSSAIHRTLDCYFRRYSFDITQCTGYDAESGMVIDETGYLDIRNIRMQMVSKTMNGREMTYTVDIYRTEDGQLAGQETVLRKAYTLLCYPGDFYIESARNVPIDA